MARTIQDFSDFVFVNMTNITLARCDNCLDPLKSGMKQDTLAALRTAPIHLGSLFGDSFIHKAEDEISQYDD